MMDKTVVYILSANYSGSTWLALMLGSHSQAVYVGELNKMFHDEQVPCRLCEERSEPCPIFADIEGIKAKHIHRQILEKSEATLLVDNSKTLAWSRRTLRDKGIHRRYVHLLRDPRAVAYSLQTRNKDIDLSDWIDKNYVIREFLLGQDLNYRQVIYGELAVNTDASLTQLCEWLEIAYQPAQKNYWDFEHHGPGRNGATAAFLNNYTASDDDYYNTRKRTHFHDLRWKDSLSGDVVAGIVGETRMRTFMKDFGLCFSADKLARIPGDRVHA